MLFLQTKQDLVNKVLVSFEQMGASQEQLTLESEKLKTDDFYLEIWLKATT